MIEATYKRTPNSNRGVLTVTDITTRRTIKVDALSGSIKEANSSWVSGRSPIPRSAEVQGGKLYIWVNPNKVNQRGQVPLNGKDIGEFFPISSSTKDSTVIWSKDKTKIRTVIGGHLDNYKLWDKILKKVKDLFGAPGSAGCVVISADSETQWNKAMAVREMLYGAWKNGQEHVELQVI